MLIEQSMFAMMREQSGMSLREAAELLELSLDSVERLDAGSLNLTVQQAQVMKGMSWKQGSLGFKPGKPSLVVPANQSEKLVSKDRLRKSAIGQFFTPKPIADFMANMFSSPTGDVFLLDAGAGTGALTKAFLEKWRGNDETASLRVQAFESDHDTIPLLQSAFDGMLGGNVTVLEINPGDFIEHAAKWVGFGKRAPFTHAILNPPYKKIGTSSDHRALLSKAGLETVNLYSGFLGMAMAMTMRGGEVVAIIPRSFCNGPYYLPFRRFMMRRAAISRIHIFNSRKNAFSADAVLQENIIIKLTVGVRQGEVKISSSTDQDFHDYCEVIRPFSDVVMADDPDCFIHISTREQIGERVLTKFRCTLQELGIECATGPVVDFRLKEHLLQVSGNNSAPLLYPGHFAGGRLEWPKANSKKPNAIHLSKETMKWLMPRGYYAVVKRFSSKEEKRRVYASVVEPDTLVSEWIGFENHLNVFHKRKKPISAELAWGLSAYLNSGWVDQHFRVFNGHTQVNATDLRKLPYPNPASLVSLGQWFNGAGTVESELIDAQLAQLQS